MAAPEEPKKGEHEAPDATFTPKMAMEFHLTPEKTAAIRRCLDRGRLTITVSKVDLVQGGRLFGGYEYD